jgi:hypothetical protein
MKTFMPWLDLTALKLLRDDPREFYTFAIAVLAGDYANRLYPPEPDDWNRGDEHLRSALRKYLLSRADTPRRRKWKNVLIEALIDRSSGRSPHRASTTLLKDLAGSLSPSDAGRRDAFFAASRACASAGMFQASRHFLDLGYDRVELDAEKTSGFRDALSAILVSIQRGNAEVALGRWEAIRGRAVPGGTTRKVYAMVNRYLALWLGIEEIQLVDSPLDPVDAGWRELVHSRRVRVVGPGARLSTGKRFDSDLTARILRGNALTDAADSADREIMYLNSDPDLPPDRLVLVLGALQQLRHVATKSKPSRLDLPRHHHTEQRVRRLFPTGHPNMLPAVVLDLLAGGADLLFVEGADFYSSKEIYEIPVGNRARLHLCNSIASHNANENRQLVKNLVTAGRVTGDDKFLAAVALDDDEYFRLLDQNLGEPEQ